MGAQPSPYGPQQGSSTGTAVATGMSAGAIVAIVVGVVVLLVVAVIGILAVLAIHGTRTYISASKTAEARSSLAMIARSAQVAYETKNAELGSADAGRLLCGSASHSVPTSLSMVSGKKYQSAPGDWTGDGPDAGWECLRFTYDMPQYFMYSYTATGPGKPGDSFTAKANGDLNGDGVPSTFTIQGRVGAGSSLDVSPSIAEVDPQE